MSDANEVITFQIGHYANFIGTHWWNMQEASFCYSENGAISLDINHDVLFREGLNPQREITFTPRLIAVDTKGSLKSLRKEGTLYSVTHTEEKIDALWDDAFEVLKKNPEKKNSFLQELENNDAAKTDSFCQSGLQRINSHSKSYDLDNTVDVWSDFLKTNLHPRSLCLIDEYGTNDEDSSFGNFNQGVIAYNNGINRNVIEDSLRLYAEECNYLQGFHVLMDAYNGFSGIGSCILQHLDDEYRSKPSLCFPVYQNSNRMLSVEKEKEQVYRLLSTLLSFNDLNDHSSVFSPLSLCNDIISFDRPYVKFPYLKYKPELQYHTSAILATAVETLTSPYRLKERRFKMSDISEATTLSGRKLVSSNICLPFPLKERMYFSTVMQNETSNYAMSSLTPLSQSVACKDLLLQSAVLRGIPNENYNNPRTPHHLIADKYELFSQYLQKCSPCSMTIASIFQEKCSTAIPFPNIFTKEVSSNGFLSVEGPYYENKDICSVPVATSLSNTNQAGEFIGCLLSLTEKRNFKQYAKWASESHLEEDNLKEALQNLKALQENYDSNSQ